MKLASQYDHILKRVLNTYHEISEMLPLVRRLQQKFGEGENFQEALGLIYADIFGFHGKTYGFFRRRGNRRRPYTVLLCYI